jgi:hypothetical protein
VDNLDSAGDLISDFNLDSFRSVSCATKVAAEKMKSTDKPRDNDFTPNLPVILPPFITRPQEMLAPEPGNPKFIEAIGESAC